MQQIPILPVPNQAAKAVLDGQNCQIRIYQKPQGVFVDLTADGVSIATGMLARDAVPLVCRDYAGFSGNLMFVDTRGRSDPDYAGMGSRYSLVYLTAAEYALI